MLLCFIHSELKKKRGKFTSASETDLLDGSLLRRKKPTLKQSIKNIFFRKRWENPLYMYLSLFC